MKNKIILFSILIFGGVMLFSGAQNVSAEICENSLKPKNAPKSANEAQCQAADSAFDAATIIVTGTSHPQIQANAKAMYIKPFFWANEIAKDPKYSSKFNEGLKLGDAIAFLKERIAKNANDRLYAIDNAYQEVYGQDSTPQEQAQWDADVKAQKAWYAVIVTKEIGKLNSDPTKRAAIINDAYMRSMGRAATPENLIFWKSRAEHFRLIINANKNRLYSGDGYEDLIQTLRTAFIAKYGAEPSPKELKIALTKVTDQRMTYEQMMQSKVSLK